MRELNISFPDECYIIVYVHSSPLDWIGAYPSKLHQQIVTNDRGNMPRHFDTYEEARAFIKSESLCPCVIVPTAGKNAIELFEKQCADNEINQDRN